MATRTLIIGVGSIGHRHLRCFSLTDRARLSVCEIDRQLKEEMAEQYPVEATFNSLEEALQDPPEVAVICTPAHLHIPMAHQLADLGVHLLIEKPLSTSLEDVDSLIEKVAQKQLTAAVAYVNRLNPLLAALRQAIHSGEYGEPMQLTLVSGQDFPFYRPTYRDIYYNDRATGGGAIQDALTHAINVGQWLCGDIQGLVADADHQVLNGVEVEDTVHVIARHGKTMASYSLNQFQAPTESTLTVACTKGTLRCQSHEQRLSVMTAPEQPWQVLLETSLERDELFVAQANMFLDAVAGQGPVRCTLAEGRETLRANLAILQSVDQGFDRFAY